MISVKTLGGAIVLALALSFSQVSLGQEVLADGQVVKVDEPAGKISLKHGPIQSLGMNEDGKTDDFRVKDWPPVQCALRAGDKIRFAAERINGEPTITRVEK